MTSYETLETTLTERDAWGTAHTVRVEWVPDPMTDDDPKRDSVGDTRRAWPDVEHPPVRLEHRQGEVVLTEFPFRGTRFAYAPFRRDDDGPLDPGDYRILSSTL